MTVASEKIHLQTRGNTDVIDITEQVQETLDQKGLQAGIATVFCPSSTSAITTLEYESGCIQDLERLFEQLAPQEYDYAHNARWGDGNGHSHLRAALLKPSLTIPFETGRLMLGAWQQVVYVDFDNRPRQRTLIVQLIGE